MFAQAPSIASVGNAANTAVGLAQGGAFWVSGANLGPAEQVDASTVPLETTLAGTRVVLTPAAGGTPVEAYPISVSAANVAAILPSTTALGNYNVTVVTEAGTSDPVPAAVVARAFGIATLNKLGTGTATMANISEDGKAVGLTAPVKPGQTVALLGTGLGPIPGADNDLPGEVDLRGDVEVRVLVGDTVINPTYAGRVADVPGADRIVFTLPDNTPTGCTLPLVVRVAGQASPAASIPVAAAGQSICAHPFLSEESLRRIEGGGEAVYGAFSLTAFSFQVAITGLPIPLPPIDIRSETVGGAFQRISGANLDTATAEVAPPIGSCQVIKGALSQSGQRVDVQVTGLDAGTLTLAGPNVNNRAFEKAPGNAYSLSLAAPSATGSSQAVVAPGTYTLAGAGGTDIGPFTGQVRIAGGLTWTNRDAITQVNRANGLTINWSGAGADDVVVIQGLAGRQAGANYDGSLFTCYARGTANTFTVPPSILQQLPQADGITITGLTPNLSSIGLLIVAGSNANAQNGRFTAPLRAGGNVDFGFFTYLFGGAKTLNYR